MLNMSLPPYGCRGERQRQASDNAGAAEVSASTQQKSIYCEKKKKRIFTVEVKCAVGPSGPLGKPSFRWEAGAPRFCVHRSPGCGRRKRWRPLDQTSPLAVRGSERALGPPRGHGRPGRMTLSAHGKDKGGVGGHRNQTTKTGDSWTGRGKPEKTQGTRERRTEPNDVGQAHNTRNEK